MHHPSTLAILIDTSAGVASYSDAFFTFRNIIGGYRKSGFGREKGLEGLAAYSQVKTVCIKHA